MTGRRMPHVDGRMIPVPGYDLVAPRCINCRRSGTENLVVGFWDPRVPPSGLAFLVCRNRCRPAFIPAYKGPRGAVAR